MFRRSEWIWSNNESKPNEWARFKLSFELDSLPSSAVFNIATETKYYMTINGNLRVFDGGLFRESSTGNGYYDNVEIAPDLIKGSNEIVIDVWYYGNGGRNNVAVSQAGIIFECKSLGLFSNASVQSCVISNYYKTEMDNPSYLYGGHNIGYDARKTDNQFHESCVVVQYGSQPFGLLEERPIPLMDFAENILTEYTHDNDVYRVKLPHAMQCSPYMKIEASGGEVIDIRSDRYAVKGGPGDHYSLYKGHRYEYICKNGEQDYSGYNYIYGEELLFSIPNNVKVLELGYRESNYPTRITRNYNTGNKRLDTLLTKCVRTLKVCMRENFMDCPDRERGQWIGDVSVQAPQVFYCLDENAQLLLKKAIYDFIRLRKGDRLVGNVPGESFCELPSQSLNAISEVGMLAAYYENTKDKTVFELSYEPIISYLKLWDIAEDGFVTERKGDWRWFDHGYNVDGKVLENCWYYSALKFAKTIAAELKITKDIEFLDKRIDSIASNFDNAFWKDNCYKSGDIVDDRANAMAVIAGLVGRDKFIHIRHILLSVFNSTTYMENYVLLALCEMGYKEDAMKRMMSRYSPLIENENSTLWEDFFVLGTRNHAWSGSPLTVIHKYFPELL